MTSNDKQTTCDKQLTCALYLRVSTDEQVESLDMQESTLRAFASRRNWQVVACYSDVQSGSDFERAALLQVAAAAQNKEFDILLIRRVDRLGRDVVQNYMYLAQIWDCVDIWEEQTGAQIKHNLAIDKLFLNIKNAYSQYERDNLIERVSAGCEHKKKKCKETNTYYNRNRGQYSVKRIIITEEVLLLHDHGVIPADIARRFNTDVRTIRSIIKDRAKWNLLTQAQKQVFLQAAQEREQEVREGKSKRITCK
jgi:DNA invertase Pin-like site-specific DNA recombinase